MLPARRTILLSCLLAACLCTVPAVAATPAQVAAFFRAVQLDDVKKVEQLVGREVNANEINPVGGEPALVIAVREDAMRVFAALLAHPGTDLEAQAMNGNTALMMAAFKGKQPAVAALLAKGAQVNRPGWTPLHYAAASGDEAIVRLLLERKAKLDALSPRASGAYTPLMMAAREGKAPVAALLLGQGADPGLKNTEGLTAARIAERAGHTGLAAMIASFKP